MEVILLLPEVLPLTQPNFLLISLLIIYQKAQIFTIRLPEQIVMLKILYLVEQRITYTPSTGVIDITNTGVTANTYGSATEIPVFTVNAQGQLDSAGTVSVAGVSSTSFDSSSGTFTINTADGGSYVTTIADSDFTNKRARESVSVTDAGGDGSVTYNQSTGVITYNGPTATEVRAHMVAGTGVTYDSASGVIAIGQPVATTDSVTFSGLAVSGNFVVNGTQTTVNTETTVVSDPLLHIADSNNHDVVDIGFVGNYSLDAGSTIRHTGLFRDASNGEYYLFSGLVQDDLDSNNVVNVGGTGWAISTLNANVTGTYAGFDSDFATKTTDDLTEGSTNLYYTTARADSDAKNAVSGGTAYYIHGCYWSYCNKRYSDRS